MRIIRVKSCDGCPFIEIDDDTTETVVFCEHPDSPNNYNVIHYWKTSTQPDKCPLEDVQGIIRKL